MNNKKNTNREMKFILKREKLFECSTINSWFMNEFISSLFPLWMKLYLSSTWLNDQDNGKQNNIKQNKNIK